MTTTDQVIEQEIDKINLCKCVRVCMGHDDTKLAIKHLASTLIEKERLDERKESIQSTLDALDGMGMDDKVVRDECNPEYHYVKGFNNAIKMARENINSLL